MDDIKPGWWRNVDPVRLNLEYSDTCVCGQNGLDWDQVSGFINDAAFSDRDLEPYWLEEIAKRMPAPAAPAAPERVPA